MTTINANVQVRLRPIGRWTLKFAAYAHRYGFHIPHRLVCAITNRSWQVRFGEGEWRSVRIDMRGRVVG